MKDKFVKIETAAEMTELSIETVRKWVKERRIRRFVRAVRIRESDLMRFAQNRPSRDEFSDKMQ